MSFRRWAQNLLNRILQGNLQASSSIPSMMQVTPGMRRPEPVTDTEREALELEITEVENERKRRQERIQHDIENGFSRIEHILHGNNIRSYIVSTPKGTLRALEDFLAGIARKKETNPLAKGLSEEEKHYLSYIREGKDYNGNYTPELLQWAEVHVETIWNRIWNKRSQDPNKGRLDF